MLQNISNLPYPVVQKLTLTKKKLAMLFVCLLCLISNYCFGNGVQIDSLLHRSLTTYNKGEKANMLLEIARQYYLTDREKAIQFAQQSQALFREQGDAAMAAKSINIEGAVYFAQGEYAKASETFTEALSLAEKVGDSLQVAKILNNLGNINLKQGNLNTAISQLMRAGKIFLEFDMNEGAIAIENSLSSIYRSTGAYEKAHEHLTEGLHLAKHSNSIHYQGILYQNLGALLIEEGKFSESLEANKKALSAKIKTSDSQNIVKTYINLGLCYQKTLNSYAADTCYAKALNLAQDYHLIADEAYVLMHLAFLNLQKMKYTKADSLLELSLPLAEKIMDRELQMQIHNYLYFSDSVKGQYKTALAHFQKVSQLENELQNNFSEDNLATLENLYKLAKEENRLQEQVIAKKRSNIQFLIAAIIILILIALLIFQQVYHKSQRKVADLTGENLRTQMNPHFIFNILSSIHSFILKNNKQASSMYLLKFSRLLRLMLDNSQLKLVPLQDEIEALKLYLELENMRFDHRLEYEIIIDKEIDTLMFKIPTLLLQPFVENSILHGLQKKKGKGKIEIRLDYIDNAIHCSITDNGIGRKKAEEIKLQTNKEHTSHGSRLTENRLKLINSIYGKQYKLCYTDLSELNTQKSGTKVEFDLPIMN